jgi:sterol carrier protein 2
VNSPSGGLESKGHPLGATVRDVTRDGDLIDRSQGIAMIWYLTQQLRGWSGDMQVKELIPSKDGKSAAPAYALAHNLGLGGSCVVSVLRRPDFFRPGGEDGRARFGYNHGAECRATTEADEAKVRSRSHFSPFARAHL